MIFISERGKEDYLKKEKLEPKEGPNYQTWKSENNLVMTWLINPMENDVSQTFLFYKVAKDIWKAVKQTYSDIENMLEQFKLETSLIDLKYGNLDVTEYFNALS